MGARFLILVRYFVPHKTSSFRQVSKNIRHVQMFYVFVVPGTFCPVPMTLKADFLGHFSIQPDLRD